MRKRYVTQMFMMLTVLLILIVLCISVIGFSYLRSKTTEEQITYNQLNVNQAAKNVSSLLTSQVQLLDSLATDSELIEILKDHQINRVREEDMVFTIEKRLNEKLASMIPKRVNLYHITYDPAPGINSAVATPFEQAYLQDSRVDAAQASIYKYNFILSQEVKDFITGRAYGKIQLQVNELVLMDYYSDLRTQQNDFYIVNEEGMMISNYRKDLIGKLFFHLKQGDLDTEYLKFQENNDKFMVFHQQVPHTNWYVMSEINDSLIQREVSQLKWPIFIVLLIAVLLIAILSLFFSSMIAKPIQYINGVLEEVAGGNLNVRAEFEEANEFSSIGENFNAMIIKINEQLWTIKKQENMKRLVELDFLRAQINPHFIYNTLSSIRFYVEMNKTSEAERMLMHFSTVLRKTLSRSEEMIALKEELNTLMSYVELQKLRYKDGFEVVYKLQDGSEEIWIPAFILQPIVENAIYYNMNEKEKTVIQVEVTADQQFLNITIQDNGIGMSQDRIESALKQKTNINKVGIKNVDERMKLIYGQEFGLKIDSQEGEGTTVVYRVPIMGKPDKRTIETL
ncbi:sensor histidine kinase [Gottschalkiaceae bacterium SANA]|nr:sensor histidine kinase [Gottschalkiaceae bacterium SANA]